MKFIVTGTNHRFSPLEIRDRLSFSKKKLREVSRFLKTVPGIRSFLILSTCNRSEIYAWAGRETDLRRIFCEAHEMSREELSPFLYHYEGQEALRHFVRVACGLDSQIVGETQILGQVRQSVDHAEDIESLDLESLGSVRKAVSLAEKIRRIAQLDGFSGTVADAAFELIQRNTPAFRGKQFLLIGTGKVMESFVPRLAREGIRPVIISNRNHEKAAAWAQATGGEAGHLGDLSALVPQAEIIISATSCPHAILKKEHFRGQKKPVLVLDLAVPRDAEPLIKEITGVKLFDLDDLGFAAVEGRQQEPIKAAERMAHEECEDLWKELSGSEPVKVLLR